MQHNSVDRPSAGVLSLTARRSKVPYLDRAVLRAREHPFAVFLEADGGHIASVSVVCCYCLRVV